MVLVEDWRVVVPAFRLKAGKGDGLTLLDTRSKLRCVQEIGSGGNMTHEREIGRFTVGLLRS